MNAGSSNDSVNRIVPPDGGGGGGGAHVTSIGYIEVREGASEFKPIHDPADIAMLILAGLGGVLAGVILAKLV